VTVLARFALDKTRCPTPFFVKGQSCRIWNNFPRAQTGVRSRPTVRRLVRRRCRVVVGVPVERRPVVLIGVVAVEEARAVPARERVVPEVADDDIVAVVAAHLVVFPALDDPGI
jgi:hypothetical protein